MFNKGLPVVLAIIVVAALLWLFLPGDEPTGDGTGETAPAIDISEFGDAEIADETRTQDWLV